MARESSINDFGLLIAYVLPGFTALLGISSAVGSLGPWLGNSAEIPTVGGFLSITLASVGVGLTVSTIRWLVIDPIHHRTGIHPPTWDFSRLGENVQAFRVLVEVHYHYYLFHANMLIALLIVFSARWLAPSPVAPPHGLPDLGLGVLCMLFFLGSRDSLRRYYLRTGQLLHRQRRGGDRKASPRSQVA